LKNDAVVAMVTGGMADGVVIGVIASSPAKYDLSPAAQERLRKSGVSQPVLDAMQARMQPAVASAVPAGVSGGARAAKPGAASALPPQPYVLHVQGETKRPLAAAKTQVAIIKSKKKNLNALAAEGALSHALQSATQQAVGQAAGSLGSAASSLGSAAGGVVGGLFQRRSPTVTLVWGVPGRPANEIAASQSANLELAYDAVPGVNVEDFAPVLVRLVPARDDWRLVGATQAKEDAAQSAMPEWAMYEAFLEEKIPVTVTKLAPGRFEVVPSAALGPGEYALVLRPVAKTKRFAGAHVTGDQGEGQLFNLAWSFTVKP
ncbi:MAG: hypothetical protein ACRD5F_05900, partial [Candidatus Acidiferrales bacterium]